MLTLKTRIYAGFGVLVALAVGLTLFAASELSAIQTSVGKMSALADNTVRALEVSKSLQTMQRAALEYRYEGTENAAKEGVEAAANAIDTLQAAAKATLSEDRREIYDRLASAVRTFQSKRDALVGLTKEIAADRAKLFTGGDELTAAAAKLIEEARASGEYAALAAGQVERDVLLVRVANWRFLATHDPQGPATFTANVEKASTSIAAMEKSELADSARALIGPVKSALSGYKTSFGDIAPKIIKSSELYGGEIVPQIREMQKNIATAQATLSGDFIKARTAAEETISTTSFMQEIMSGLALVLGGLIAFFVGRSIIRPVAGMTDAMGRLAAGDTDAEIPSRDATDEIGAMAKAVEVFKQNAVERMRLEAEQKETQARTMAQRKAEMNKLADQFEKAVGNVVDTVSSASTELNAAATTLTQTAATTEKLSGSVAAASEEASSNVQTVASATDEMASSVSEISRQVAESSRIAGEAVKQAEKTDTRIHELSQAASRIGDVIKLITAIAEQTNLLALNATIEAARAGDMGRGFAVVAQEVKALAAQTAKATDEIGTQIAGMQTATQESVGAIKEIGATIARIAEIATAVSTAVEEQGAATQEIARNVQQAARGTSEVAADIIEVNKGAGETGSASAQVLSSAQSLSHESNKLKLEVSKFVSTVRAA
jgi:methyl-accepting chemotaxis protein